MPHMPISATTPTTPAPAIAVQYDSGPAGDIFATEAGLAALARTRKWLLLLAIGLFVYAVVGTLGGAGAVFVAYQVAYVEVGPSEVDYEGGVQFLVIGIANLSFATLAIIGGILLMRFHSASGRAIRLRRPEDLERVLIAQHRLWRFVCIVLVVVLALPFLVFSLLVAADGNWP